MSNDRTVRRLTALTQSASTARVLNLSQLHNRNPDDPDLAAHPLFKNRLLNRSIILKHRLRPHEYVLFDKVRTTATKLMVPIDSTDLKIGARTIFIGQRDFEEASQAVFGSDLSPSSLDRRTLDLIDDLPTLDPFLLREHLKRHDVEPARAYFAISEADVLRMHAFVRAEIMDLVTMSAGDGKGAYTYAAKLVDKLLSSSPESGFEPLRATLKLSDQEYLDGVFSWRGFLYYKWMLGDLMKPMAEVMKEVGTIFPRGPRDPDAAAYIPEARQKIATAMAKTVSDLQGMLGVYDRAYAGLTRDNQPSAFRDFLLTAPGMFNTLGEQLGAIQHITSFWRYRFPAGQRPMITPTELMDLFLDFEDSMSFGADGQSRAA